MGTGGIKTFVLTIAVLLIAVDWAGFLWGDQHRDIAFVVAQVGFFIMAHALITSERK